MADEEKNRQMECVKGEKLNCERLVDVQRFQDDSIKFTNSMEKTMQTLNRFRSYGEAGLCDVSLEIDNKFFPVHRNILAANSPFFHNMFTSGMKDSREKNLKLVSMTSTALEVILDFFYTCSIAISMENVEELLEAASFLLLDSIKEACVRLLERNLNDSNFLFVKVLSERFVLVDLKKKVEDVINQSFHKIVKHREDTFKEIALEFLELPVEVVTDIISRDELMVENEEDVYFAVLKWVKHDVENRKHCLKDLFERLRYGSLSADFIQHQLEKEPLLSQCEEASTFLKKQLGKANESSDACKRQQRPSTQIKSFVVGIRDDKAFCFDVENSQSLCLPTPYFFSDDRFLNVVVEGNMLFADDGYSTIAKCVLKSDSTSLCWEILPATPSRREAFCVVVLNGFVYVIGGRPMNVWNKAYNHVECYDIQLNQWSEVASLQSPRYSCTAVVTERYIFTFGGTCSVHIPRLPNKVYLEKYNPESNTWSYAAPIPTARKNPLTLYTHGKIYVVGGSDYHLPTPCEVYVPSLNEWHTIAHLSSMKYIDRHCNWMLSIDNDVHIIGYRNMDSRGCNHGYKYDRTANSWQKVEVLGREDIQFCGLCSVQLKRFYLKDCVLSSEEPGDIATETESSGSTEYNEQWSTDSLSY